MTTYPMGWLDRVVAINFPGRDYIMIHGAGVLTALNPNFPSVPAVSYAALTGAKKIQETHTTSASTGAGGSWYAFASPSGQTTPEHPLPFGYDNVTAYLLDNPFGIGPGQGLRLQGIPPDPEFPGSLPTMTPQAEANAFATYVASIPGNTGVNYRGHGFVTPSTWGAASDTATDARRNWSADAAFQFTGLGSRCTLNVSGSASADINTGGFIAHVYQNIKPIPGVPISINFLSTRQADWTVFLNMPNDVPSLDGGYTFSISKGTPDGPSFLRISGSGFHD